MQYTDIHGALYFLDDDVTNNISEMEHLDKIYAQRAIQVSKKTGKDVFYSLKSHTNVEWEQANYFIIPIEREEIEKITAQFHEKYYIGIIYYHDNV